MQFLQSIFVSLATQPTVLDPVSTQGPVSPGYPPNAECCRHILLPIKIVWSTVPFPLCIYEDVTCPKPHRVSRPQLCNFVVLARTSIPHEACRGCAPTPRSNCKKSGWDPQHSPCWAGCWIWCPASRLAITTANRSGWFFFPFPNGNVTQLLFKWISYVDF